MPSEKKIEAAQDALWENGYYVSRKAIGKALTAAEQAEPAPAARSGAVKWLRSDSAGSVLLYTLRQKGWRKGEPVEVNDVTVRIEGANGSDTDIEPIVQTILAALEPTEPATDTGPVVLSEKSFTEIMGWVDNPPKPTEKLKEIYQAYIDNKSKSKSENTRPPESRLREALEHIARGLSLTFTSSPTKMSGNEAQEIARAALAQGADDERA